jgi:hypothetical protein
LREDEVSFRLRRSQVEDERWLTLSGTTEAVRTACLEVARDLQLGATTQCVNPAISRFRFRSHWPQVEIAAYCFGSDGHVQVRIVGSKPVGIDERASDYAHVLVSAFANRLERDMNPALTPAEAAHKERERRLLRSLAVLQWLPAALSVLASVLAAIFTDGWRLDAYLLAIWWSLWAFVPALETVRKRIVGTDSVFDYASLALWVGVCVCALPRCSKSVQ